MRHLTINPRQLGNPGFVTTYIGDVIGVSPWAEGGAGGNGGNWGVAGGVGNPGYKGGNYSTSGIWTPAGTGSPAGLYIDGSSFASWGSIGNRLGRAG